MMETPGFEEFVQREFPQGASDMEGVNRRQFMKIMTASFALAGAGLTGCRQPVARIMPYSRQPDRIIPGLPIYYATSLPRAKDNIPLVVETHQARPTKIEGNHLYGAYGGSTDVFAQASVLDLYDPDGATSSSRGTRTIKQADVYDLLQSVHDKYLSTDGQGLAFLAEESTSPTRAGMQSKLLKKFPRAVWAEYEPVDSNNPEIATKRLLGRRLRPHYRLRKTRRILSLDADFLHKEPGNLLYARDFADGRRFLHSGEAEPDKMNRLYQVESALTVTGSMADHRLRMTTGRIPAFAALVAAEVMRQKQADNALEGKLNKWAASVSVDRQWIEECVSDLINFEGESLVVCGSHLPVEVHQLVFFINDLIGANGRTVAYLELPDKEAVTITDLASEIEKGRVETLVIIGGNPAYNAPADLNWGQLQSSVKEVIRYGYYVDETSLLTIEKKGHHIAATHFLESWSDGRAFDGTICAVQPMILPLFNGMQELELLARLSGAEITDPYSLVLETFSALTAEFDKEKAFNRFLNSGLLPDTAFKAVKVKADSLRLKSTLATADFAPSIQSKNSLEVRIVPDNHTWDGRYNNNGWLQECPDPMTKLTWDNAIQISPRLAKDIGYDPRTSTFLKISAKTSSTFKGGFDVAPVAEITIDGVTIKGPVHIQPGLADYTVLLSMGYGRTKTGRIGKGAGFSVFPFIKAKTPAYSSGAVLRLTGETFYLANTQRHWSMEGRGIIREANVEDYQEHPDFAQKIGIESHSPAIYGADEDKSLQFKVANQPRGGSAYEMPKFGGAQQWGMTIDLNTCIGCNACVVACQSENNIPIVGKEQVLRGREMQWIRLDRYYSSGDEKANREEIPADPQVSLMPVNCMHCENAPCEQVCPVNATVHDDEGLNVMAYNRCVGTRYCANNCPYKVRRFNFFDWNKRDLDHLYEGPIGPAGMPELQKMKMNPDVTVRMRGVMEKCTYCQQRIDQAKIAQKVKARDSDDVLVPDGGIKTACQQVCPTSAIAFGDILDPTTEISRIKASDRNYSLLGYLNTRPRTTYLAKLRNPNKRMPDYNDMPLSRMEYEARVGHGADRQSNGSENGGH